MSHTLRNHAVGRLQLLYTVYGDQGVCSVGLVDGQDPYVVGSMTTLALALAAKVADVLPSDASIYGWKTLDRDLLLALEGAFGTPFPGTKGTIPGGEAYESVTATVTGFTSAPDLDHRTEQTLIRLRVGNTLAITAGEKFFSAAGDPDWLALTSFLTTDARCWGDVSGRKAEARDTIAVQFNAYYQNHRGT